MIEGEVEGKGRKEEKRIVQHSSLTHDDENQKLSGNQRAEIDITSPQGVVRITRDKGNPVRWIMPAIPVFGRMKQEDDCTFKPAWTT